MTRQRVASAVLAEGVPRRLLVVQKHFIQGFGGIPESTLLLGNHLRRLEIVVDVLSEEGVYRDAGILETLPSTRGAGFEEDAELPLSQYGGVLVAGSWTAMAIPIAIRAKLARVPVSYAPKGNLCAVEFTRPRDLKKVFYLPTIEIIPLLLCRTMIFSSHLELKHSVLPSFWLKRKQMIVPELFKVPPPSRALVRAERTNYAGSLTFGFLAEISPRKGLMELVRGFLEWCEQPNREGRPTLRVVGDPRPASERYLAKVKRYAQGHPFGDQVVWENGKRGDSRTEFFQQVDVFVCPSRFESFGLTPLEALWEGTPVLCGPMIGSLEYLASSPAVEILRDLSPASIAAGLEYLRSNLDQAKADAAAFRPRLAEAFGGEHLAGTFARALFGDRRERHGTRGGGVFEVRRDG